MSVGEEGELKIARLLIFCSAPAKNTCRFAISGKDVW